MCCSQHDSMAQNGSGCAPSSVLTPTASAPVESATTTDSISSRIGT